MKRIVPFYFVLLLTVAQLARAATYTWSSPASGSWHTATNWFPNAIPGAGDTVLITNAGTYTVVITNSVSPAALRIGSPGSPTLVVDNFATLSCASCVITNGGTMTWSNSWINGALTILPGGQLNCAAPNNSFLYGLIITNQGTVTWSGGGLSSGGPPSTAIYNSGLWQIASNNNFVYGGGGSGTPVWVNTGTLRKSGGGLTSISTFNFQNFGGVVEVQSGTLEFNGGTTNFLSGVFTNTAPATVNLINGVWTDAGGIFSGTGTNNYSNGTFNLRTNVPPGLKFISGNIWITGTNTFQNAGAITNLTLDGATLRGTNLVTGTLNFNNGSIPEKLTIATNGQLIVGGGPVNKLLYGVTLINQGTVVCGGTMNVGGGGSIFNSGLWLIPGDFSVYNGNNPHIFWTNTGIIRKTAGTGLANQLSELDDNFANLPGGLVECLAGRLILNSDTNSQLGGTFNAVGLIDLAGGTWNDAGGLATGSGTNRFFSGTLNLRTNVPPTLQLVGGNIFITGTNTFQNAGSITNLTLDGATLGGTNIVSGGTLTMNSGAMTGQLLVQPDGQLVFATSATKAISPLTLFNRGTVTVNGLGVGSGNTIIVNSGLWQMPGDFGLGYGGVGTMAFTNSGTFRKTGGSGASDNTPIRFFNQPGALVQVDSGTLQLPVGATNFSGTLRLNGGTLGANGNVAVAGGTLDGAGTFGANNFTGGNISPGLGGAGLMAFSAGLNLNSNVTLVIDGIGPVPGVSYDALSVTGAVVLANANLQITALPNFPAGTTFTLINNDSTDAVIGTFAGLPENSVVTVNAQTFRIHYAGGTGNDVTLVRDGVISGPQLAMQSYATNAWTFTGSNAIPLTAFTIRASTNLVTWTNIGVATSSVSGAWSFTDTNAWRYARRFYNTTN